MDNFSTDTLMQLMMAAQGMGVMPLPQNRGMSEANPYDYQGLQTLVPEDDSFFGPIGNMVANAIPMLSAEGIDGRRTPVFKTNFRARNSGQSGFSHLMQRQNRAVLGMAGTSQQKEMAQGWNSLFGEDSFAHTAVDTLMTGERERDAGHAVLSFLGSEMGAQLAQPLLNNLLGYDRGVGANVANQYSPQMLSSYAARYGIGNGTPTLGEGGSFNAFNPFSEEALQTRAALATNVSTGTQAAMYDGNVKKASMHGASEKFVSSLIADAFTSGEADKYLTVGNPEAQRRRADEYNKAMEAGDTEKANRIKAEMDALEGTDTIQGVTDKRMRLTNQYGEYAKKKVDATGRLEEAKERGDTDAQKQIEEEISKYDTEMGQLSSQLDAIGKKIGEAMEPLLESVTGVVSSLKDFYGSEEEAARALDNLTGGQGTKDKAAADKVRDQLTELKVLGGMAGLDPAVVGSFMQSNIGAIGAKGSSISQGSAFQGQTGLAFTNDFMKQIAAMGGDPKKVSMFMGAANDSLNAYNQSEGKDLSVLLQYAKKNKRFEGREDDFAEIMRLSTTGSYEDFQKAKKMLAKIGFGSEDIYEQIRNDPALMASAEAALDTNEAEAAGQHGVAMRNAENARMRGEQGLNATERMRYSALRESGLTSQQIDEAMGSAEYDAIKATLGHERGGDENEKDFSMRQHAAENLEREKEIARKKNPNATEDEINRIAVSEFTRKGYAKGLSRKIQDELGEARGNARNDALSNLDYFGGKEGHTIETDSTNGYSFFQTVGASAADGRLTRSALSEAGKNTFDAFQLLGDNVLDMDGNQISQEDVAKAREQFESLMKEGKGEEARNVISGLVGRLGAQSRDVIEANVKGAYRTTETIAKEKEDNGLVTDLLQDKGMADKMRGMSHDNQVIYARLSKELKETPENSEKRKEIESQLKKMEEDAAKDATSDAENIVSGLQSGDMQKFAEALKNGNVTMEQFFETIKKIIGLGGGIVMGPGDVSHGKITEAVNGGEARAKFLKDGSISFSSRVGELSEEDTKSYLSVLRGKEVSDKDAKSYTKRLEKAREGDKKSYVSLLESEDQLLGRSEKELESKIKKAKTPDEKKQLEEQLEGVKTQRKGLGEQADRVKGMTDDQFKAEVGELVSKKDDEKKTTAKDSATGIDGLIGKIERLIQVLETRASNGSEGNM